MHALSYLCHSSSPTNFKENVGIKFLHGHMHYIHIYFLDLRQTISCNGKGKIFNFLRRHCQINFGYNKSFFTGVVALACFVLWKPEFKLHSRKKSISLQSKLNEWNYNEKWPKHNFLKIQHHAQNQYCLWTGVKEEEELGMVYGLCPAGDTAQWYFNLNLK
jgi:hypothetical protein